MIENLAPKTQVLFCKPGIDPTGPFQHGVLEPGFVTSGPTLDGFYFVMFWYIAPTGLTGEIRNKSASERCPASWLIPRNTVPETWVEEAWRKYR